MVKLPFLPTILGALLALASLAPLAGCNTVSGLGQDVEAAGEAITGTAEETKEQL